jgi:hypothetical protein
MFVFGAVCRVGAALKSEWRVRRQSTNWSA